MAKIMFGQGVAEMRGSNAGNTFSRNRGGAYSRNRVTPLNPQTTRQVSVRNSMTDLTTLWSSTLTQDQRDAWISFAAAFPTTDVFGAVLVLTGLQMYVRQNLALLQAGLARIDEAPVNLDVQSLLTLTLGVDISDGDFDVTFTPSPLDADMFLQLFATPAISPGISFVKNKLRLIYTGAESTTSPLEVASAWQAVFGDFPQEGQKIVIAGRIINQVNGAVSSQLQAYALVVP